jgi:hypothetical protein
MREKEGRLKMAGNLPQNEEEKKAWVESKKGDWRTILSEIKIEGLIVESDKKLIITEDKITGFLENNIPIAFLKKIKKIEVSNEDPIEDVDLGTNEDGKNKAVEVKKVGSFNSEYDENGRLASGNILIYEPITVDKNANRNEELIIENGFRDTLTHEIGHAVHGDFSMDEMKEWEEVMKQDQTKVTWYVSYSETKSEPTKKREDFCESFMLFVKDPSFLKIISEKRFEYVKKLFETYMDSENLPNFQRSLDWNQKFTDAFLEENGYTKEQFKNSYLSNL